jgi:predicted RND superfamily exporter protein
MPTARDIALIFLSLQALVIALVPLAIFSGLAYGVYRLHRLAQVYLRKAQGAMQRVNDAVDRASGAVTRPLINGHATGRLLTETAKKLAGR